MKNKTENPTRLKKVSNFNGNQYILSWVIFSVIGIAIGLISGNRFFQTIIYSILISGGLTIYVIIRDIIGKKNHKKAINRNPLAGLKNIGFEIENNGDYYGLIGDYNGFIFRIYYDWDKLSRGILSFGDIAVMGYYKPILKNQEKNTVDEDLLNQLNKKHVKSMWSQKRIFSTYGPYFFTLRLNSYLFASTAKIISSLNKIVTEFNDNNLIRINKAEVLDDNNIYAPPIDTFPPFVCVFSNKQMTKSRMP